MHVSLTHQSVRKSHTWPHLLFSSVASELFHINSDLPTSFHPLPITQLSRIKYQDFNLTYAASFSSKQKDIRTILLVMITYFTKGFLLLHTLLVFLIPQFDTLQDILTISNPIRDGDLLVSNRETFALGFFSPGESTNRYVGIWFYKAPEQPVVWVANRDNPINDNSGVFLINLHGNLVLYGEDQKQPIWSTNIVTKSNNNTTLARLIHSGNLMLLINETSEVLWESFDNPTDTFLPGMKLGLDRMNGLNRILTSWKSKDDPGTGNCSFILNTNSSSPELFLYKGNILWWRSGHWNGIGWSGIPTSSSNDSVMNFNLFNNQYETSTIWGLRYPDVSLLSRLVVNGSGSIQRFVSEISDQEWDILGTVPLDRCELWAVWCIW